MSRNCVTIQYARQNSGLVTLKWTCLKTFSLQKALHLVESMLYDCYKYWATFRATCHSRRCRLTEIVRCSVNTPFWIQGPHTTIHGCPCVWTYSSKRCVHTTFLLIGIKRQCELWLTKTEGLDSRLHYDFSVMINSPVATFVSFFFCILLSVASWACYSFQMVSTCSQLAKKKIISILFLNFIFHQNTKTVCQWKRTEVRAGLNTADTNLEEAEPRTEQDHISVRWPRRERRKLKHGRQWNMGLYCPEGPQPVEQ